MTSPGEEGGRSDKSVTNGDKGGGRYWQVPFAPVTWEGGGEQKIVTWEGEGGKNL